MKINNPVDPTVSEQWKNVHAFYNYSGSPENPLLNIFLSLNVSAYQPPDELPDLPKAWTETDIPVWRQSALDDKQRFCDVISQLYLSYDKTDDPAIPVPVAAIFLKNNLLKSEKIVFSPEHYRTIRDFTLYCLAYATNRAGGRDGGLPPVCQLSVPLLPDDISVADIIKLSAAISLEPHKIADTEGETASTDLSLTETSEPAAEYRIDDLTILPEDDDDFVENFERLFSRADVQLRLGKSMPEPKFPD